MTCATCGRENPPHLTFCQECGQRLGPRIAPPTPPIGLGGDYGMPEPAPVPSRLASSMGPGPSPIAAAAQLQIQQSQQAQQAQQASAGGGEQRRCRVCATANGPTLRYCTSCGSTLDPLPGAAQPQGAGGSAMATVGVPRMVEAAPAPPAPIQHAPMAPSPASFAATALASDPIGAQAQRAPAPALAPAGPPAPIAPIAPMRVVDLGTAARAEGPRVCHRCRGVVDGGAQFCKFCGASLAESGAHVNGFASGAEPASPRADAPAPAAPAAAPAPAPAPVAAARPPTVPMQAAGGQLGDPTPYSAFAPPGMSGAQQLQPAVHAQAPAPPAPAPPAPAPAPAAAPPPAAPAPAAPAAAAPVARPVVRGRLVVIAKSGADGPSYPIGDALDVGRTEGQIIVGEDPYLSPRHVRIAWTGSKLVLRDLGSTNGVYIRLVAARDMNAGTPEKRGPKGGPVEDKVPGEVAVPLHDQDLILVGQQVLRFESATAGAAGDAGFGPATEHGTLLFGSPAAPRYARLSQRTVEGVTRDVYYVRKVETVLGRESGDVVFTEDPFLSRRHAAIRVLDGDKSRAPSFALVDLGSSNGSFLRIRGEIDLVAGDHFRVGQQLFRVDFENDALDGTSPRRASG
jgi:pSer/pThr/pTyr-binding forkhead associated (FHA) protein